MTTFRGYVLLFVLIGFCSCIVGAIGCGGPKTPKRPSADDEARSVSDGVTRNVVFQEVVPAPADGDSVLPEGVRGFWGNGKPEPGIDGDDTMKWANETFEALKAKGLTTANDASGWLTQDFKNMNAWEYKVVQIDASDAGSAEYALNKLGSDRWECFSVQGNGSRQMFYLKKRKRSYLKSLPTSDLMRLVPMMRRE